MFHKIKEEVLVKIKGKRVITKTQVNKLLTNLVNIDSSKRLKQIERELLRMDKEDEVSRQAYMRTRPKHPLHMRFGPVLSKTWNADHVRRRRRVELEDERDSLLNL